MDFTSIQRRNKILAFGRLEIILRLLERASIFMAGPFFKKIAPAASKFSLS